MTLWHKPTEKPRRKNATIIVLFDDWQTFEKRWTYEYWKDGCIKWCYLSDLLKLERENKNLKKENEELIKANAEIANFFMDFKVG